MSYKLINNTGDTKDVMLYNEDTAERIVPGGLPVSAMHLSMVAGKPATLTLVLDYVHTDVSNTRDLKVVMRIPGTQQFEEVKEIRWKSGQTLKLP